MTVPEGYVLVPKEWAEKYFTDRTWDELSEPTINETAQYLKISVDKIKKDLRSIYCPLRKTKIGAKGRGNQIKFLKSSVELYKNWLQQK